MSTYAKPRGYNTLAFVNGLVGRWYKPYNGFLSGSMRYAPGAPSARVLTFTFSAAPGDLSTITIPDGVYNTPTTPSPVFTFTYGGSPGAGVIPLVSGGGTAAQAATAAAIALGTQLNHWIVANPSAGVLVLTSKQPGLNQVPILGGSTNIGFSTLSSSPTPVLPGRFGKSGCWFPAI